MTNKINEGDFSIKKENKKDYRETVISRSNLSNEFTIASLEDHQAKLEKNKKEIAAQIKLSQAVVENVAKNHLFVSKMSDEALATASYLYETKQVLAQAEAKLKEIKTTLKKYDDTLAVIYTKFGFKKPEKAIKFKVVYENEEPG